MGDQPLLFSITMDTAKTSIKIQSKHKHDSSKQYYIECTQKHLKSVNFHQSIKGFYNRIKMAIESKSPQELRAYYIMQTNALKLTLEEISKFDDETTKWTLTLKQRKPTATASTSSDSEKDAMKQIQFVVKQVKEKFNAEKEERLKLEERIMALESLCTKLTKKLIKVTNDLKKEKQANKDSSDNLFGSSASLSITKDAGDEKVQSPMISSNEFETKLDAMKQ